MTREEFARRWLDPARAATLEAPRVVVRPRLTDRPSRMFTEKAPLPSRLVRTGRFLKQWATVAVAAAALFAGMALLLVKLSPYVTEYAATYLVY